MKMKNNPWMDGKWKTCSAQIIFPKNAIGEIKMAGNSLG